MTDIPAKLSAALSDRYRLERGLGAGGMATVYLAEDLRHHRQVAVKVLRPELSAHLGEDRFLREVATAAKLQHPHIVPLYDSGKADGFLFYVMPYVEGESLRQELARHGELPIPAVVRILRDVADAMAYAHQRGVVHRDIKPENVMLSGRHALVTDFGIAKAVGEATPRHDVTSSGIALGTPAYMSPEQATADPRIDHRADIYAFGVLAYELLAGEPPFVGTSAQSILAKQLAQAPYPITQHRANVPAPLADVVMKCLAKRPADRIQSAQELVAQLEGVLTPSGANTPTTASALPGFQRLPAWRYRYPVAAALLLASGAVALSLTGEPEWQFAEARPSQITTDGEVVLADLSPDGEFLAYISRREGVGALWIRDLGGGAPIRASLASGFDFTLRWSPDGTSLLYSGTDSAGVPHTAIYPRLGGAPKWESRLRGLSAWSSDGKRIAVWSVPRSAPVQLIDLASGRRDTIAVSHSLPFHAEGDWSQSTDFIVFIAKSDGRRRRWTLKALSLRDSTTRDVLEDTVPLHSPRWGQGDRSLYYVREGDLWALGMSRAGSPRGQPRLVRSGLDASQASMSRDGSRLAYVRRSAQRNLWLVPAVQGDEALRRSPVELTSGTGFNSGTPSPDGSLVAYQECLGQPAEVCRGNLFLVSTRGGQAVQLTARGDVESEPVWSPTGDALAFVVNYEGVNRIRVLRLADKTERTFEATEVGQDSPVWAPGERILYHRPGNRNYHFLDPRTGAEEPLVRNESVGWMFSAQYSPDGHSVAIRWSRENAGLWLISPREGTQKLLLAGWAYPHGWSDDGRFIYVSPQDGTTGFAVPVSGAAETRPWESLPADYDFCKPFTAIDGPAFLCGKSEGSADVWMLEKPGNIRR